MKIMELGAIGEPVRGVAVIGSLIYVGRRRLSGGVREVLPRLMKALSDSAHELGHAEHRESRQD
jgi:hypothetical protein